MPAGGRVRKATVTIRPVFSIWYVADVAHRHTRFIVTPCPDVLPHVHLDSGFMSIFI